MIAETASVIEGIKAATTVIRGMKSLDDRTSINEAVIELQGYLLDSQSAMFELQDYVEALRTRIRELEAVDESRFELVEPQLNGHKWTGRRAYRDKSTGVFYCPGCFGQHTLTPVQFDQGETAPCAACGTELGSATGTSFGGGTALPL